MAWFTAPMAHQRREFWRDVVSHDLNRRLLSYDLTRAECAPIIRSFQELDRVLPPAMIAAAKDCDADDQLLAVWLRRQAERRADWGEQWPAARGDTDARECSARAAVESSVDRLAHICAGFLQARRPWSVCGLMSGVLWFEASVAGGLNDVLGQIYQLPHMSVAPLAARAGLAIEAADDFERLLVRISDRAAQRSYFVGQRCAVPLLADVLSAASVSGEELRPLAQPGRPERLLACSGRASRPPMSLQPVQRAAV